MGTPTTASSPRELIIQNFKSRPTAVSTANYADVGRLAVLVNEINLLREEVHNLIAQTFVNPQTKEMFPQLSASVSHFASKKRLDLEQDEASTVQNGSESRSDSQDGSRTPTIRFGNTPRGRGSETVSAFKPLRKPEKARSISGERQCEGCAGCGSPDRSNFV